MSSMYAIIECFPLENSLTVGSHLISSIIHAVNRINNNGLSVSPRYTLRVMYIGLVDVLPILIRTDQFFIIVNSPLHTFSHIGSFLMSLSS